MIKKIFTLLSFIVLFQECSSQKKNYNIIKVENNTNFKQTVKLINFGKQFAITLPVQLSITNISKGEKVLKVISLYVNQQKIEGFSYIYKENGENFFNSFSRLEKNKKMNLNITLVIPIDSFQTKKILDYYHLSEYPTIERSVLLSENKSFIIDLKKITVSKNFNLYEQIFKSIIFLFNITNEITDSKSRVIEYDWLNNKTYDKYPHSEMVDIVK